jgi:Transposase DDE domain group 1
VLRQLALPQSIRSWDLTPLIEKLVKIGAKVVTHAKYVVFPLAEVAVPRPLFAALQERLGRLRLACASG